MPTWLNERTPASRGKVRCDDCYAAIPAGVRYRQTSYADDGRAYRWRDCPECEDLIPEVSEFLRDDSTFGAEEFEAWARDNPDDPRAVAYLRRRFEDETDATPAGHGDGRQSKP